MQDVITEGQLRRELDLVLVRLERCGRAALIEATSQSDPLAGDMFADAQVMASQDLEKALPEAPVTPLVPPAPQPALRADSPFEPADLPAVPPDPPPEVSL